MSANEVEELRQEIAKLQAKLSQQEAASTVHPYCASYARTCISTIIGAPDGGASLVGTELTIGGWVKSGREQGGGAFAFIQINDGSHFQDLQVYMPKEVAEATGFRDMQKTGASLLVRGELTKTPDGTKQAVELRATRVLHFGPCDSASYPMAKKKHGMEFLREKVHLRPRTNVIGAVARIRNQLAYATHNFFQRNGFLYVHTPIVTASDCEGAGEMFQVTTLLGEVDGGMMRKQPTVSREELERAEAEEAAAAASIRSLKEEMKACDDKEAKAALSGRVQAQVNTLKALKDRSAAIREQLSYVGGIKRLPDGTSIDYSLDFFGKPAYLTVSGQLNGEYYACALSNIYTFGPTFRAERSHTTRHLAEFWMIEPEMAFCALEDDMQCAEDYVRACCRHLLATSMPDLQFIVERVDKDAIERLQHVADTPFKRITYTEVIELLEQAVAGGRKFAEENMDIRWGMDLASEHERYVCEEVFKQPTIVYNYPKEIKAFYMKLNADGRTVAAMDVLVPGVGELIGGSQREDDYDVLVKKIEEGGMELEPYAGYLDLRKYGTVPHSGFGLGFERLIMFATGITNIRDVIPFPRWPGNAAY